MSKTMNFEIINANLQQQHMHTDGLHPSITSGRILIEKSIYNLVLKTNRMKHMLTTTAINYKRNNNNINSVRNINNVNNNNNRNHFISKQNNSNIIQR
ncbi:unnamed protein product [Rotaria socialis]|uniref:Uncharacterized protein n=1 Tax=Rotaria socialis TaxID=392032 RepID=A0A820TI12_9BILA|nr:unnamed protein product [Rotaria socialis]